MGYAMTEEEYMTSLLTMIKNIKVEIESLANEAVANQNELAVERLHDIAHTSTKQLMNLYLKIPDLLTKVARKKEMWPVLYDNCGVAERTAYKFVDLIELGADFHSSFAVNNLLGEKTAAREWLFYLARMIQALRMKIRHILLVQEGSRLAQT